VVYKMPAMHGTVIVSILLLVHFTSTLYVPNCTISPRCNLDVNVKVSFPEFQIAIWVRL